jgi:hypothetical protein
MRIMVEVTRVLLTALAELQARSASLPEVILVSD